MTLIKNLRWFLVFFILAALMRAYFTMPAEEKFAGVSDEGYYLRYSRTVSEEGLGCIPSLLQAHLRDPGAQLYPHPGRVGYLVLTGFWLKVFPPTFRSLAHFSFFCNVLFLILSFCFARKYTDIDTALIYTLFLASSPLLMASSRRVLQDSLLLLFWALPFWFFFDYLMTRRVRSFIVWGATFAAAVTIKEASVPLWFVFAGTWLLFRFTYRRDLPWRDLVFLCVPMFLAAAVYIVLLGGFAPFCDLFFFVVGLQAVPTEILPYTYPLFAMGPWFKFVVDFLLLSPIVTLLFIGYFFHLIMTRTFDPVRAYHFFFFVVVFVLFGLLKHAKIVRFVMALDITLCFFAVLAIREIFRSRNDAFTALTVYLFAGLVFIVNMLDYRLIYVVYNIYDSISVWLLVARRFIPFYFMPTS